MRVKQAEFARRLGVDRSHVTRLKQAGRLVIGEDGLIDVEASIEKIKQTESSRDDLRERWQKTRSETPNAKNAPETSQNGPGHEKITRADAQAQKELYLALNAKLEYERAICKLVEADAMRAAVADIATEFRLTLENLPHTIAAELVGKDIDVIRALLKQEVYRILGAIEQEFSERVKAMTTHEDA